MLSSLAALAVLLAAAEPVGVVLSSHRPGADAQAAQALVRAEQALANVGVPGLLSAAETRKRLVAAGYSDPRKCAAGKKCLKDLALILGPDAVLVGVDVARVGDEVVVHLEAVAANAEVSLAVKDATVRLKGFADALVAPLTVFARALKAKMAVHPERAERVERVPQPELEPRASRVEDRPVAKSEPLRPQPMPAAAQPAPLATEPVLERRGVKGTTVAGIVTGAAALAAGAVAVSFAVLAANDQAQWQASRYDLGGQNATRLSAGQADALVAQGNARFSVALGAGVGAGALAITAVILLTR
jgi:hypothetical protein